MENELIYLAIVFYNLDDEPNMEVQGAFKDINKAKQMLIGVMKDEGEKVLVDKLAGDEKNITIYNEWPDRAYVIKTVEVEE